MVDFKKLRSEKAQQPVIDPIEIFRRLPKPLGIKDLYTSQAEVLAAWFNRRTDRDIVIKLHTGGGKTLVGLLIAQSVLNEFREPVIYLCPTVQLVTQTLSKAEEYGIPAVPYVKKEDFAEEFTSAKAVMVCVYQALFNGNSRFGTATNGRAPTHAAGIILDDAHVAFATIRDQYTIRIERDAEEYGEIAAAFRHDFKDIGRLGTFDDVVRDTDKVSLLEVPYWGWTARADQIRTSLQGSETAKSLQWLFLRDAFQHCHCLITSAAIVITPLFPLVDLVPTFSECPRRVFMSATIGDDSAIVRTFDAKKELVEKPITSKSLAGVSERLILIPELTNVPETGIRPAVDKIAAEVSGNRNEGVVILVPSDYAAEGWQKLGTFASSTEHVSEAVAALQARRSSGPFIFSNRYDGIDLPNDSCRLLVISGLPRGVGEYERYRGNTFVGGSELDSGLAQTLEQGMGRAARGASDYSIVLLLGKDLIAWLSRSRNQSLLTSSTRAQFDIGRKVSKSIADAQELWDTIRKCLIRDRDWMEYHAEQLAELAVPIAPKSASLGTAAIERKAFRLFREGYLEKAVEQLGSYVAITDHLDGKTKGWLLQFAARVADAWGHKSRAQELQQHAYAANKNVIRPKVMPPYIAADVPGEQAQRVAAKVSEFGYRRGYLAFFDETVSFLTAESSANQFEDALAELGRILGFHAERPENDYGIGPDVLWLLGNQEGLVIEAKSRKNDGNPLSKDEHGQLLAATEWFKSVYPKHNTHRVSIHPSGFATKNASAQGSLVLTLDKLAGLAVDARALIESLCTSAIPQEQLVHKAARELKSRQLASVNIISNYLSAFVDAS
jgi:hypothetical protein